VRRLIICVFMLLGTVAHAQSSSPQTVTYEAVTASSPVGVSRLRVTPVATGAYAVDFSIVAPNPTQHTGHIRGLATRDGDRLTLRVPVFRDDGVLDTPSDTPSLCTIVINTNEARANVITEDQCAGFSGAAASFAEQGQKLVRVR
jgi:hypothetical protein